MITRERFLPDFETYEACLGYPASESLFFDIETTGFSPDSSFLYLIGVLRRAKNGWLVTQWLGQSPQDEALILREFSKAAAGCSHLIHFNGTTFDLPYLKKKAEHLGIPFAPASMESLDLYQRFRPLQKLLSLERMNQTSLEAFLGVGRTDKMDGKKLIPVCKEYMAGGSSQLERLLLLHNLEDVTGMTALLSLSAYLKFLEASPADPVAFSSFSLTEENARIVFSYAPALPQPVEKNLGQSGTLQLDFTRGALTLPLFQGELLYFFPDYKNYYYLPLEDQAVHKSVASYVDKKYRRPATAATCYIRKKGVFLPQPRPLFTPDYRKDFAVREHYFEAEESAFLDSGALHAYLASLLTAGDPGLL